MATNKKAPQKEALGPALHGPRHEPTMCAGCKDVILSVRTAVSTITASPQQPLSGQHQGPQCILQSLFDTHEHHRPGRCNRLQGCPPYPFRPCMDPGRLQRFCGGYPSNTGEFRRSRPRGLALCTAGGNGTTGCPSCAPCPRWCHTWQLQDAIRHDRSGLATRSTKLQAPHGGHYASALRTNRHSAGTARPNPLSCRPSTAPRSCRHWPCTASQYLTAFHQPSILHRYLRWGTNWYQSRAACRTASRLCRCASSPPSPSYGPTACPRRPADCTSIRLRTLQVWSPARRTPLSCCQPTDPCMCSCRQRLGYRLWHGRRVYWPRHQTASSVGPGATLLGALPRGLVAGYRAGLRRAANGCTFPPAF
mmetsp:Transcript_58353/g.96703  ORF Transcript_58353/g.96703 Transcript_58353/m.96703 type:complete len:364 (+) Transcript_58353:1245-2336(+)